MSNLDIQNNTPQGPEYESASLEERELITNVNDTIINHFKGKEDVERLTVCNVLDEPSMDDLLAERLTRANKQIELMNSAERVVYLNKQEVRSPLDFEIIDLEAEVGTLAVIKTRTNFYQLPVPMESYTSRPLMINIHAEVDGEDQNLIREGVNIADGARANDVARVIKHVAVNDEKGNKENFYYLLSNTNEGWVPEKYVQEISEDQLPLDRTKPHEVPEDIFTIISYGLSLSEEQKNGIQILREVDPFGANSQKNQITDDIKHSFDGSMEAYGDGIPDDKSENSIFSIGHQVKVIQPDYDELHMLVQIPGTEDVFLVEKRALVQGFLSPKIQILRDLLSRFVGNPYSWGALDSVNFDCSKFTREILAAFGYVIPAGSNFQGEIPLRRIEANVQETILMPFNFSQLKDLFEGIEVEQVANKVALMELPGHIMFVLFDEDGNPEYYHSVGYLGDADNLKNLKYPFRIMHQKENLNDQYGVPIRPNEERASVNLVFLDEFKD